MSILNVDKIQPIGGGSTITVDATDIQASTGTITANSYTGVDNTLKVSIGGTEYVRTHSTGQVSIGSTFMWRTDTVAQVYGKSPDLSLSRFNDQFMIAGNETSGAINTGAGIQFFGHDGVSERGMAYIRGLKENGTSGDRASYLAFATRINGGTLEERLRITSDGVIGINDTNPGSGKKVKVVVANNSSYQTAVNLTNNINADINFYIKTNESLIAPSTNTPLCLGTGGAEKVRITSGGAVGINETSPAAMLHVENDNANSSTYYLNTDAAILVQNKNSNATAKTVLKLEGPVGSGDCALVYGAGGTNMIFADRQYERLRIESGGDVKINTGDIYFGTAGKGIVLGATSNQDAHTLDHYQEGTTALTVKCGSVTVPLLNNTCKWTRIGNTLHLSAWIRISGGASASGISATDPVKITGFPFATVGNSTGRTRLVFTGYSFGNVSNATWGWMVVADGATSTEHSLHWGNPNFSTITAPDGNNITSGGNYLSSEIYLNGHMFV